MCGAFSLGIYFSLAMENSTSDIMDTTNGPTLPSEYVVGMIV